MAGILPKYRWLGLAGALGRRPGVQIALSLRGHTGRPVVQSPGFDVREGEGQRSAGRGGGGGAHVQGGGGVARLVGACVADVRAGPGGGDNYDGYPTGPM